jgi:polyhydroxyalkanoate synthase subunit PhaC
MAEKLMEARQEQGTSEVGKEVVLRPPAGVLPPNNRTARQESLEAIQRDLAALRATVAALEAQRHKQAAIAADQPPGKRFDIAEHAAESAGAADGALGLPLMGVKRADLRASLRQLAGQGLKSPRLVIKHSTGFLGEFSRVLRGKSNLAADPKDRRFQDPAWATSWFYGTVLQTYLAAQESLYAFADTADLSPAESERARFALRLVIEALAPTNTLMGNPAALKKVIDSGGANLVRGFRHWLDDMIHNGGMPAQVNMKAFEVGKNLSLSPGAVVFKNELLELIQYAPATEEVYGRPLLIIPPQINKFYMLDLAPGKSLVEYLVKQGFMVFVISWRNPTPNQRHWGLDTYLRAANEAIDASRAIAMSEDVNVMAACAGGMTLAALLSHLAVNGDRRIHAASLLVTVLDSKANSFFDVFATPTTITAAKAASRNNGVLKGSEMARIFNWMRPNDLIWNYWVNNYLFGEEPPAFDILYWNNDTTNLPAQLHNDLLDVFLENPFRNPGTLTVLGTPIDAQKITNDTFILAGITDHITPWQARYATTQLLGGRCDFVLSSSGHIQSVVNPPGNPKASFYTNTNPGAAGADPEQWLAGAKKQPGSWWEYWREWLKNRSGALQPAPQTLGNEQFTPGPAAPGTYVYS